jgi:PAS domain S-box-containing protein
MELLHKDGRMIPVEIHARLLFDRQGVPREIFGIARDITQRKEAESALKKSEEQFKFLAENMGDVVWTLDMEFNTTYISPSIEKVLGYTPEERLKQKLEEMVTPKSLDHIGSILVKELEREKRADIDPDRFITVEVEYYHRDGSIIWMENQISDQGHKKSGR